MDQIEDFKILNVQYLIKETQYEDYRRENGKFDIMSKLIEKRIDERKPSDWLNLIKYFEEILFMQNLIHQHGYEKFFYILNMGELRKLKRKDSLIKIGEYYRGIYIILDGQVFKESYVQVGCPEKENLKIGQVLGDEEYHEELHLSVTNIRAFTNSQLFYISYDSYKYVTVNQIMRSLLPSLQAQSHNLFVMQQGVSRLKARNQDRIFNSKGYLKQHLLDNFISLNQICRFDLEKLVVEGTLQRIKTNEYVYREGRDIGFIYFILRGEFRCMEYTASTLETVTQETLNITLRGKEQTNMKMKPICLINKGNILGFPDMIFSNTHINSSLCISKQEGLVWKVPKDFFLGRVNYFFNSQTFNYLMSNISLKKANNYCNMDNLITVSKAETIHHERTRVPSLLFDRSICIPNLNIKTQSENRIAFIDQIKRVQVFKQTSDTQPKLTKFRVQQILKFRCPKRLQEDGKNTDKKTITNLSMSQSKHKHNLSVDKNINRSRITSVQSQQQSIINIGPYISIQSQQQQSIKQGPQKSRVISQFVGSQYSLLTSNLQKSYFQELSKTLNTCISVNQVI